MLNDKVYPNTPLVEVVFELRFSGIPAIECERHRFYELVKDSYPNIFVPIVKEGESIALKPQRYTMEDETATIMHAINSFSFSTKKYPGFSKYKEEYLRLFEKFNGLFNIERLTRIGWRYINLIPYSKIDDIIPIDQFLQTNLTLSNGYNAFENIDITTTFTEGQSRINFKLQAMESDEKNALLLDIDCYRTDDLQASKITEYLEESHACSRQLFERVITDEYRKYLKGETA